MKQIDFRHDLLPLKDKIYRTALRITLNAQEAEDLTQDTLVKVWTQRSELNEVKSIEAYCITVCRNLSLDLIARRERQNESLETRMENSPTDPVDHEPTPLEQLEHNERLKRVGQLWAALPERQRTAMQLRDIEGMTYTEAAQAMGITEELFKVTLHRARKTIRTQYEKLENYGL